MATTQVLLGNPGGVVWLSVQAHGGSVTVERQDGDDWALSETLSSDGIWPLSLGLVATRFTPEGEASYRLTDSAGNKIRASL